MKIGIDITFLKDQYSNRGIGTYGKELLSNLLQDQTNEFVLFGFDNAKSNYEALRIRKQSNIKFVSLGKPRKSNLSNLFYFKFSFSGKIYKEKLDFYFAPHFERGLPLGKVKTAVMVHDVIPLTTNSFSSRSGLANKIKGIFYKYNLERAKSADLILTNSDFSKRELVLRGGFDESKIKRIYLGIKNNFRTINIDQDTREIRRILLLYKVSKPYVLYYGGLEFNKNVISLIHSFKNIIKRFPDLKLVIVGKEFKIGWDGKVQALTPQAKEILSLVDDLKLKHNMIFTGEADNDHLPIILNNAEAFVHLSEYEGFGFSVLEAMAANIPTISARRSCYPEILGDATHFVDPKNIESVTEGILKVLEEDKYRKDLIKKGNLLSDEYNWAKTAKETMKAFKDEFHKIPNLKIDYLITNFYPIKGGAEQNCFNLARSSAKKGHNVTVYTSNSNNKSLKLNDSFDNIKIDRSKKTNDKYYLGFYPDLFNKLFKSRQDILHVHGFGFIWHDFCLIFKKIFKSNTIFINTPHGPFMAHGQYSFFKRFLKSVYTFIQRMYLNWLYSYVIAVNPVQTSWITKEYGINPSKIFYIPNSIHDDFTNFVEDTETITKLKLEKKFVISFIGRFERYKGLQDLVNAIIKLKETHKNITLVAIGNKGAFLEKIEEIIKDNKAEGYIHILQNPKNDTLKTILNISKIFVMPSSWEAFGVSIIEAMAFKNAIISTRTEGGEFLIKEDENGYLYNYGDVVDLTSRLELLIKDKEKLQTIQENNSVKSKEFLQENVYHKYEELLKTAIRK